MKWPHRRKHARREKKQTQIYCYKLKENTKKNTNK